MISWLIEANGWGVFVKLISISRTAILLIGVSYKFTVFGIFPEIRKARKPWLNSDKELNHLSTVSCSLCAGNPVLAAEDADPSRRNPPFLCNFKRRKIFHNQPSLFTILLFIIFHNRNNLNPYFENPAAFYLAILQVLEAVFYFLARLTDFLSLALFLRTLR